MTSFFIYLFEASLGLAFVYLLYRVFIRKHTKFQTNRFSLLLFIGLSLSMPLAEFSLDLSPDTVFADGSTYAENIDKAWEEISQTNSILIPQDLDSSKIGASPLLIFYLTGTIFCAVPILISWINLVLLIAKTPKHKEKGFTWLESPGSLSFSAFYYIFLSKELCSLSEESQQQIIQHEKVHAEGWHSLDLLFIDIIRIVFWFHPLKNSLKRALQELHECIADAQVTQVQNKHQYSRLILQLTQKNRLHLPIHSFAYSPIKFRLAMLLKKPTKSLKYLIFPSFCALTFMAAIACTPEKDQVEKMITIESSFVQNQEKDAEAYKIEIQHQKLGEMEKGITQEPIDFIHPVGGTIYSGFGKRMHPKLKVMRMHWGLDFTAKMGTPVKAVADGEIILVRRSKGGYGNQVEIRHKNGFVSKSAHLSEVIVKSGQEVKQGELIALSGNSGLSVKPHLHFELILNDKKIDPEKYLKK